MGSTKSDVTDPSTENVDTPPEGTDETTDTETSEESTKDADAGDSDESKVDPEEGDDKDGEDEGELPTWARTKLTKANTEAAKYRTQLRDLQAKLEGAKTPEEFEAAVGELRESNTKLELQLAREKAARKHELPDDVSEALEALQSAEEIEKVASVLAKHIGGGAGTDHLKGGLDPTDEDDSPSDPRALARRTPRRR